MRDLLRIIAILAAVCISLVEAHGNVHKVTAKGGEAAPRSKIRAGIARGAGSIPGPVEGFQCDWCVLENVPVHAPRSSSAWWTKNPAAHISNRATQPKLSCMSNDAYGARGVLDVTAVRV